MSRGRREERFERAMKNAIKRHEEKLERWAKCPNHGHEPTHRELLGGNDRTLEYIKDGRFLTCYLCKTTWYNYPGFVHP